MEATRAEEGSEGYVFCGDLEDQGRFHVSEQWASQEAIDAHMATPHLADAHGSDGRARGHGRQPHQVGRRHRLQADVARQRSRWTATARPSL